MKLFFAVFHRFCEQTFKCVFHYFHVVTFCRFFEQIFERVFVELHHRYLGVVALILLQFPGQRIPRHFIFTTGLTQQGPQEVFIAAGGFRLGRTELDITVLLLPHPDVLQFIERHARRIPAMFGGRRHQPAAIGWCGWFHIRLELGE